MNLQIKERPILFSGEMVRAILEGRKTQTRRIVKIKPYDSTDDLGAHLAVNMDACPYGRPGDRLWVRETWGKVAHPLRVVFRANLADDYQWGKGKPSQGGFRWRPSIHMPRWASRINLEVKSIRAEKLNDISESDAIAEGINTDPIVGNTHNPIKSYKTLWENINGIGSWYKNPWVWVVEFKKVGVK